MIKYLKILMSGIFIVLVSGVPGQAHSLDYVEKKLVEKGRFFQSFNRPTSAFKLRDLTNNNVITSNFTGKTVVLFFINAGCWSDCPAHAKNIAKVQSMVNTSPMRDLVQFVTIITDLDKYTPDILRKFITDQEIDTSNWVFLTPDPNSQNSARQILEAFGHKTVGDDYEQKAVTHVIDMKGRWRANFNGLNFQPLDFVVYINALINFGYGIKDKHGK